MTNLTLEKYRDNIAIYCIILKYRENIAIIQKNSIAQGWSEQAGEQIQPTSFTQEKSSVFVLEPVSCHVVEEVVSSLLDGVLQPGVKQDVTSLEVRRVK